MKKFGFIVAVILVVSFVSNLNAQESRTLSNGFSVNLVTGFPAASFGADQNVANEERYRFLWGAQFGNRWYFAPQEKFGFGLMVNWIDFAMGLRTGTDDLGFNQTSDWARTTFDITFCEFGPLGTIAINDDIAIDGYYNLRPTMMVSAGVQKFSTDDLTTAYAGFGVTHALGTAFRWKVLNVGVEYVIGSVNASGTATVPDINGGTKTVDLEDSELKANSVRLILGVKF